MAYDQTKTKSDFRVGLLTLLAICILAAGITLAGGDKGLLFEKTTLVHAQMSNIGGLKKGALVTMGGMAVGKVSRIAFESGAAPHCIELSMMLSEKMRAYIKEASIPAIKTQGMLGDRYVEISAGSAEAPSLPEGAPLVGKSAADFDEALQGATQTLSETTKAMNAINKQQGSVGQFLYDKQFYTSLTDIETELHELLKDFKQHPRKYIKFSLF